jgi:hypothetical protein
MPRFSFKLENQKKHGLLRRAEESINDWSEGELSRAACRLVNFFGFWCRRDLGKGENEAGSFSQFTFDPKFSAVHVYELLTDGEA